MQIVINIKKVVFSNNRREEVKGTNIPIDLNNSKPIDITHSGNSRLIHKDPDLIVEYELEDRLLQNEPLFYKS